MGRSRSRDKNADSAVRLGFFSANESHSIQNGAYVKTNTFNEQIISNLGDVIFNSNKALAYVECSQSDRGQTCTSHYYHTYLHDINCTNQQRCKTIKVGSF